jgi:class 3 adenylate cyclase
MLKRHGDGLMALFGYPQAQVNDAERAVLAAPNVQRALADLNARNVFARRSASCWAKDLGDADRAITL